MISTRLSPYLVSTLLLLASASHAAETSLSSGTGFFVADRGVLVTNHHVVDGCDTIDVTGYGAAKLITSDEDVDLAVLQLIDDATHASATIRTSPIELGEPVLAIGYPLAFLMDSTLTVGTGIVSAENGLDGEDRWFTTNVGILSGNSGGPILDEFGAVIGVAVAKMNDEHLLETRGIVAPNVGFAIKGHVLMDYLSIFRLNEPSDQPPSPLTPRQLTEVARQFTVQVICSATTPVVASWPTVAPPSPQAQAPAATPNHASPVLPATERWIVLASRKKLSEIPNMDSDVAPLTTSIVQSNNGYFALVAGPFPRGDANSILAELVRSGRIAKDSYLTVGDRFTHFVR